MCVYKCKYSKMIPFVICESKLVYNIIQCIGGTVDAFCYHLI